MKNTRSYLHIYTRVSTIIGFPSSLETPLLATKPSRIVDEFRSKLKPNRLIRGRIGGLLSLPFNFIARPTFFSLLALHDQIKPSSLLDHRFV